MNLSKKNFSDYLENFGFRIEDLGKYSKLWKRYKVIDVNTDILYCEANTLRELVILFDKKRREDKGVIA